MADPISLLPPVRTAWEDAQSLTSVARRPLPTDLVKSVWNPWTCPLDLLPYLAAGLGLEIWRADWPEARQREIVADIWRLKRNKTKLKGIKAYLDLVGSSLVSAARPRDKRWWSGGQTPAQKAATIAVMPKIRIYPFSPPATASRAKTFWSGRSIRQTWSAGRVWEASDAAARYAARAVYVDGGVTTPVTVRGIDGDGLDASIIVALVAPASVAKGFWGGGAVPRFWGHQAYVASDAAEHVLAITPTQDATTFAVPTGLVPTAVRPTRVAEDAPGRPAQMFWGRGHWRRPNPSVAGSLAWLGSDAADHVYDEIALFEPTRQVATRMPYSFWGYSRFGRPAFSAELRVDCPTDRPVAALQWGHGLYQGRPWGRAFWRKADTAAYWAMVGAVDTAKAYRDTVWIDTALYAPIRFSAGLRFGDAGFTNFGDQRKLT